MIGVIACFMYMSNLLARFAKFITDVVAKRKLPTSAGVTTPRYRMTIRVSTFLHSANISRNYLVHTPNKCA